MFSKTISIFLALESTSYYLVIILGFLQEASAGISAVSLQYLFKDDFLFSPSEATYLDSVFSIPWIIKPLWGLISDSFPFFGYRRKSYLIMFSIFQVLLWFMLAFMIRNIAIGITTLIFGSIASAFINVICEALIVEITQKVSKNKSEIAKQSEASFNVSSFFGARYLGTLITAYFGGVLLEKTNKSFSTIFIFPFNLDLNFKAFGLSALFCLLSAITSCLIFESRTTKKFLKVGDLSSEKDKDEANNLNHSDSQPETVKQLLMKLFRFLSQKQVFYPIFFLFLLSIRPSSNQAIFFFYTNVLHFEPEFIGILSFLHSLGSILGIFIYNKFFKLVNYQKFFISTTIIYVFLDLSQIILILRVNQIYSIPDKVFCFLDSFMTDFMLEFNLFPVLIITCRLSPKKIEGTMYALMMSIYNFSSIIGNQMGAGLVTLLGITEKNFENLYLLIIFTNIWVVSVLPFMICTDFGAAQNAAENNIENKEEKIQSKEENTPENKKKSTSLIEMGNKEKNHYYQMAAD